MGGYLDLEGSKLKRLISWRQRLLKGTSVKIKKIKMQLLNPQY